MLKQKHNNPVSAQSARKALTDEELDQMINSPIPTAHTLKHWRTVYPNSRPSRMSFNARAEALVRNIHTHKFGRIILMMVFTDTVKGEPYLVFPTLGNRYAFRSEAEVAEYLDNEGAHIIEDFIRKRCMARINNKNRDAGVKNVKLITSHTNLWRWVPIDRYTPDMIATLNKRGVSDGGKNSRKHPLSGSTRTKTNQQIRSTRREQP
jgi:hypothetical protein